MQKFGRGLVAFNFVASFLFLGVALMTLYSGRYNAKKTIDDLSKLEREYNEELTRAEEDKPNVKSPNEQGWKFWEREWKVAETAYEKKARTTLPQDSEKVRLQYRNDIKLLKDSEEANVKAGDETMGKALASLKELREKVEAGRIERAKMKKEIDEREAQKKDLTNRGIQMAVKAVDAVSRQGELKTQFEAMEGAGK